MKKIKMFCHKLVILFHKDTVKNRVNKLASDARNRIDAMPTKTPESLKAHLSMMVTASQAQGGFAGMNFLFVIVGVIVTITVLAYAIPLLWPIAATASNNITSMNGTDNGTLMIKSFWPVAMLVVGLGIGVGLIVYALKWFDIIG